MLFIFISLPCGSDSHTNEQAKVQKKSDMCKYISLFLRILGVFGDF